MCIEILVSWFHDPEKYEWVKIEASASENLIGLDDVVAKLSDGRFELYQVKFTIDSERDDLKLSFKWLLDKKGRGTSFLQKWAQDVKKYRSDGLAVAALQTNRKPDVEFASCLESGKVIVSKIPDLVMQKLLEQFGNKSEIESFFDQFDFQHSLPRIDRFEDLLRDRLVGQHTTLEGWLRLKDKVKSWAQEADQPTSGGRIYLSHIHDLLTLSISRPLSQFFEVPDGYLPPTEEFHDNIIARTKMAGATVIEGAPGMGKSTYLSFLTDQLERSGHPVIRHHYALAAQGVDDRITYSNVEYSLQNQIALLFPHLFSQGKSERESLGHWLKIVADNIDDPNKPLVVIIDGLDHVVRERPEITQLTHLINQLLPNQTRVCLIFGTQPVGNTALPPALLAQVDRGKNWIKVPSMGINAIRSWIEKLDEKDVIRSPFNPENTQSWIADISAAFQKISNGYPLHLIYSVQYMINRNRSFNEHDIAKLPTCPDGDIHVYYQSLWVGLPASAKQVLLLISSVDFPWPDRSSIGTCFSDSLQFLDAFSMVEHLLEQRRSGIVAFHGSLLVYLRRQQEYTLSRTDILNKVQSWLDTRAPEYWKWAWKWIIDAELGTPLILISGITHEWSRTSFLKGYPLQHIQHIITEAEIYAHSLKLFSELVRLRLIKIRLINGPEFQGYHYFDFLENVLSLNSEGYGLWWRADNIRIVEDKELPIIARLLGREHRDVLNSCYDEALRRLKFLVRFSDHGNSNRINALIEIIIDILTCHSEPDFVKLTTFLDRLRDKKQFFIKAIKLLIKNGNGRTIADFPIANVPKKAQLEFQEYCVLFTDPHQRAKYINSLDERSAIGRIARYFVGSRNPLKSIRFPNVPSRDHASSLYFRSVFFIALANYLTGTSKAPALSDDMRSVESYIRAATQALKYAAHEIASLIRTKTTLDGLEIFSIFDTLSLLRKGEGDFDQQMVWQGLYQSLPIISAHLLLLLPENMRTSQMDKQKLQDMQSNSWLHGVYWITVLSDNSIEVDNTISKHLLGCDLLRIKTRKDNTATLADDSVELASISLRSRQPEIAHAASELAAKHFLGYGYRKDTSLGEIFNAFESCSEQQAGDIPDWLHRTSRFVHGMYDYTEREIRHIPGMYLSLLAKHIPSRIVDEFSYYLKEGSWSLARQCLGAYIAAAPLASEIELALINSITDPEILTALIERSEREPEFKNLALRKANELGGLPEPEKRGTSPLSDREINLDFVDYPPDRMMGLQEELTRQNIYLSDDFIECWLQYWIEQKKDREIVDAYNSAWSDDGSFPSHFARCIPKVVPLVLALDGTKHAFDWAVRDTKLNNHWGQWYGEKAEKTLQYYANIFKDLHEDFIFQSTTRDAIRSSNSWIIAPSSQLVSFYLAADKPELAVEVTNVMVKNLEAEIEHLELAPLIWKDLAVPDNEVAAHLCMLHFEWPDRLARKKTALEIKTLLSNDVIVKDIFLKRLHTSKYEAEICDLLSVLTLCNGQIYTDEEISAAINYPSILSNIILGELGYSCSDIEIDPIEKAADVSENLDKNFRNGQNGIAQMYFTCLSALSQSIGVSLISRLKHEWGTVSSREEFYHFNHSSFYGDYFYPQDETTHSLSTKPETVMLSAYLRTLAYANSELDARIEDVYHASIQSLALGGVITSLSPNQPPKNWPVLEKLKVDASVPDVSCLSAFLTQLSSNQNPIVFAKGPVSIDHSALTSDLEVLMIQAEDNFLIDVQAIFKAWDMKGSGNEDNFLFLADRKFPEFLGRFEHDWQCTGFCKPNFSMGDNPISSIAVHEESVDFYTGSVINGTWAYWLYKWFPVHFREMGSSMGTYTTIPSNMLSSLKDIYGGNFFLIGRLKLLDRRSYSMRSQVNIVYHSIKYEIN